MPFNLYQRLRSLFPASCRQVGTVTGISGSTVTVQLPDGASTVVIGSAQIGTMVYFSNGAVEGIAPSLTVVDIEI